MHVISIGAQVVFQALSDQIRIRIIRLLADSKDEACLCEIAESLDEPEYKLSRHIKVLRQAGLLSAEKDGRWIYHKLIKGSRPLNPLYKFIRDIPDSDKHFQNDLARFTNRKKNRTNGRCRTENSSPKFTSRKYRI